MSYEFEDNFLENPEIFAINRLEAHSDHKYFQSLESLEMGDENLKKSLNGVWKISYAKNPELRVKNFYEKRFDVSAWDTVKVPGHVEMQGFGEPQYVNTMYPWDGHEQIIPPMIPKDFNPVSSYVKTFDVPKNWNKKAIYISFQGVESAFKIWVNGEFVGYSEDTFTPAEFDLSPYILDGENRIAVEVYKWCSGSWLEDQDFWRLSGIFRDVYLYTVPDIHVRDLKITTEIDEDYKKVKILTEIKLKYLEEKSVTIIQEIFDDEKNLVASDEKDTDMNIEIFEMDIDHPELWSAENPYLYETIITIKDSLTEEVIEVISQKIGVRDFKIRDRLMLINGKRVVFKGVNRHEFSCYNGRVVSEDEMLWDIKFLKANNFNAVRTSHYPNMTKWYELCDEYGLYVIDETNIESHGTWQKMGACRPDFVVPDGKPEWLGTVLDRGRSMLERDKNHPSIIIWSCGNEAYGGENLYKLSQYFRKADPTRVVHYEGVFWDRRYNETSDMESRMYAKVKDIEEYLNSDPAKPFINCEYSHAMGNSNGGLHKYTELEERYPMYQGGFIWDYIDQAIMRRDENGVEYLAFGGDYDDRATDYNFCVNGLVYGDRKPSPKMQEVKGLFSDYKVFPEKNSVIIKNQSLFTNISKYTTQYKVMRDGVEIFKGETILNLKALSTDEFQLDIPEFKVSGEYIVEITLKLRKDEKYAMKGHEVAFGQYIYKIKNENLEGKIFENTRKVRVEDCDVNIGVKGDGFHHIFSKGYGSIISMKYMGKEFIKAPLMPNFWRALTDNDRGNKLGFRSAQWKIASLYAKHTDVNLEERDGSAFITYCYELPTTPISKCKVIYKIDISGKIEVTLDYKGVDGLSEMPVFGTTFKIPANYENIEFYGMGPEESYIDRVHGARLGVFQKKVKDELSQYVIPQESGNHVGVRWFTVTDKTGNGLKIISENMEFSALPNTVHELESAYHHKDISNSNYTVLNINKVQMGVGGDDSWGAPTHDEYLIKSDRDMSFS
ncbi:MAG: glycoside hydrolase family 2 TIM barrel-domain containing protein, partial [Fusobacteriaceae bacterium]